MCCALELYIILVSFKRYIVCFAFFLKDMHIFFPFLHFVFTLLTLLTDGQTCCSFKFEYDSFVKHVIEVNTIVTNTR